ELDIAGHAAPVVGQPQPIGMLLTRLLHATPLAGLKRRLGSDSGTVQTTCDNNGLVRSMNRGIRAPNRVPSNGEERARRSRVRMGSAAPGVRRAISAKDRP